MKKENFLSGLVVSAICLLAYSLAGYGGTYVSDPPPAAGLSNPDQSLNLTPELSTEQEKSMVDHEAVVYFISGTAEIFRKDSTAWEPLSVDTVVREGDKIKTAPDSLVDIYYDRFYLNRLRIEANAVALFDSIEPTHLTLLEGDLLNMLEGLPKGSTYEISTPTAVAAVRGTSFLLGFNAQSQLKNTSVITGTVYSFPLFGEAHRINPEKFYPVTAGNMFEFDARLLGTDSADTLSPRMMTDVEKSFLESAIDSSRNNLIGYLGDSRLLDQATGAWDQLKNNPEKIGLILSLWKEHEKDYFQTVTISFDGKGDSSKDAVVVKSAIISSDLEAKQQDALVNAVETYAGGTNPDEEVRYNFVEDDASKK